MDRESQNLERFVHAQEGAYARALAELEAGEKRGHWMWFVLPQLRGLGRSHMAWEYGVAGRREAEAYLRHPALGPRLIECVKAMLHHPHLSAAEILGDIDALKFRSCLTLFAEVAQDEPCFHEALATFYGGEADALTLELLKAGGSD